MNWRFLLLQSQKVGGTGSRNVFPGNLIEILFVCSVLRGFEPRTCAYGRLNIWIMYYNLSFSQSGVLLSYLNAVSPERMEAVAVRWRSSLYPIPLADGFSRGVGRQKGIHNTQGWQRWGLCWGKYEMWRSGRQSSESVTRGAAGEVKKWRNAG